MPVNTNLYCHDESKQIGKVYKGLVSVSLKGYKPNEKEDPETGKGTACWFQDCYGMTLAPGVAVDEWDTKGLIWCSEFENSYTFFVLIDKAEYHNLIQTARIFGYKIQTSEEISKPRYFGDPSGYVEILQHRNGWIVLPAELFSHNPLPNQKG